ncbi:MAG TPA: MogA/MoaB family molybdenum cofactor biosynthesis protein [Candidatus Saccharimonadaceae bacterium]|jgi:molybdenum cofactor biosynthesis protein B|nr:MogA/MoaB family molybdenum cofactor biosynthesis protein [Candidatus Saccharimonadaceae bacterium]
MAVKRGARRVHAHAADATRPAVCAVITVSDSRRGRDDTSGAALTALLERAGHVVAMRGWVGDDAAAIRRAVRESLARADVDAVLITGGTGIAPRDVTPEAVAPLLDRTLPGFGEAFRVFSLSDVGPAAWLSRAGAGVARGRLVVWLPGSRRAVTLALRRVLLPELGHAVRLLGRPSHSR